MGLGHGEDGIGGGVSRGRCCWDWRWGSLGGLGRGGSGWDLNEGVERELYDGIQCI